MAENQQKKEETVVVSRGIPGLVCGYLEDFTEADIVVNSAPKNMKLDQAGQVSSSILSRAGNGIQNECNEKFPQGIKHGEVAITSAYRLPYSLVFHCTVQDMNHENSFTEMAKVLQNCLKEADGKLFYKNDGTSGVAKTIAFPLLGTGPKNLSPEICHVFYRTILSFCLGPTKSLENAYIIVLPKCKNLIEIIQNLKPFDEFQQITHEMSYPYKWVETQKNFDLYTLDKGTEEYEIVYEDFIHHGPLNVQVSGIQRVQNKILYKTYLQTRCQHKMTSKSASKELWMSCQPNHANSLVKDGLNANNKKISQTGEGYHFFSESNSADESIEQGTDRTVILCSVGIRKITEGKREYNENSIAKNVTAVDNSHAPSTYVIFDRNLFYPNYIVNYKI